MKRSKRPPCSEPGSRIINDDSFDPIGGRVVHPVTDGMRAILVRGATRRKTAPAALVLVALIGCQESASELASATQCVQLRDHAADLYVARAAGSAIEEIDSDAHARAFARSLGEAFIERCGASYPARAVQCAIAADSARELTACLPALAGTPTQPGHPGVQPDVGAASPVLPVELAGNLDTAEK